MVRIEYDADEWYPHYFFREVIDKRRKHGFEDVPDFEYVRWLEIVDAYWELQLELKKRLAEQDKKRIERLAK